MAAPSYGGGEGLLKISGRALSEAGASRKGQSEHGQTELGLCEEGEGRHERNHLPREMAWAKRLAWPKWLLYNQRPVELMGG